MGLPEVASAPLHRPCARMIARRNVRVGCCGRKSGVQQEDRPRSPGRRSWGTGSCEVNGQTVMNSLRRLEFDPTWAKGVVSAVKTARFCVVRGARLGSPQRQQEIVPCCCSTPGQKHRVSAEEFDYCRMVCTRLMILSYASEAIADGLNPFAISHTAITISCKASGSNAMASCAPNRADTPAAK